MRNKFVHLHVHSHYSLLDGLARPVDLAKEAKNQGSTAVAITDHGNMHGVIEFYKACKKEGVKAIIGCECFLAVRSLQDKEPRIDNKRYHLTLLAKNRIGYENLVKMVTISNLEGLYYKPRIDFDLLKKHKEGLIALSACLNGEVPKTFLEKGIDEAKKVAKKYFDLFGEDFYLEIQDHPNIPEQKLANEALVKISKELNIPLVATNDVHYVKKEDADAHDTMICIQTNTMKDSKDRMSMIESDFSMRSPEEMWEAFNDTSEACENTIKIADKCNLDFEFGKNLLPKFIDENGLSDDEFLIKKCREGFIKRFGFDSETLENINENTFNKEAKEKYADRINMELGIIQSMGFSSYFLIVWDFVKWSKENNIAVGPGRGSAAGSLVSYALEVTDLDPIENGLFFERFLNPERVSMPDIDLDFADDRRDEVIEYVSKKYGKDRVAQICTFGTMAARAAVKDVGRAFGIPFGEMNELAKLIPEKPGTTLEDAIRQSTELKKDIESNPVHQKIFDTAKKLEGSVRHISVHACAVVISPDEIIKYTPLQHPPKDEKIIITQFSAKPLEDLGMLKMDFLGLRNITIMEKAKKIISRTKNIDIDFSKININEDKKTYKLLANAETVGVFQLESSGMRRYLKDLKPTCFDDIVAMVALFRPGPMDNIPQFIKGKHKPASVKYPHPVLKEFLKETHGIAVYQEQVQRIAQEFAGFSLGEGYILIKAVAKKIPKLLEEQREKFILGAEKRGYSKKEAEKLFDIIEPFAGYGFNKAHAACYATIACRTAYLKANFPTEFMAALLSCDSGNTDRIIRDIEECERINIKILPPSVNVSLKNFTVASGNEIRFGLSAIKGIGDSVVDEILKTRKEGGKFKDFTDFVSRVPQKIINKKSLESLAKSGAFSEFSDPKTIIEDIDKISEFAKSLENQKQHDNLSLFGEIDESHSLPSLVLNNNIKSSRIERLSWEKEILGLFVSDHPLKNMEGYFAKKGTLIEKFYSDKMPKNPVKIGGILSAFRKINTKQKTTMASLVIEDPSGKIEVVVFPKTFEKYSNLFNENEILFIKGKWDKRNGNIQLVAEEIKNESFEKAREEAKNIPKLENEIINKEKIDCVENSYQDEQIESVNNTELINECYSNQINNLWIIKIPEGVNKSVLQKICTIFVKNPGEYNVEIDVCDKKLSLDLKVDKTEKLENEVNQIISSN